MAGDPTRSLLLSPRIYDLQTNETRPFWPQKERGPDDVIVKLRLVS